MDGNKWDGTGLVGDVVKGKWKGERLVLGWLRCGVTEGRERQGREERKE